MKPGGSLRSTGPYDVSLSRKVTDGSVGMSWQHYDEMFSINARKEAAWRGA